jgi:hypothetical protein
MSMYQFGKAKGNEMEKPLEEVILGLRLAGKQLIMQIR